jgi:PPM family protein phosphatase
MPRSKAIKAPKVEIFSLSNLGYAKEDNEDSIFISDDNVLFAIADGMGGEPFGEVASEIAVRSLQQMWRDEHPYSLPEDDHPEWLERAFDFANESIVRHSDKDTRTYGMGTTLVSALITKGGATIGNVGDSRAILIDGRRGTTITRDHVEAEIDLSGRRGGRKRGGLTRRLGGDFSVQTDVFSVALSPGITLLLCSDGLHGVVPFDEIIEMVHDNKVAEECCEALVETALEYGGPDNISVIVCRILDD